MLISPGSQRVKLREFSGLSIGPGTRQSSTGYSVVNHPLLCLDYQLNAYWDGLKLPPTLGCSDTYFESY